MDDQTMNQVLHGLKTMQAVAERIEHRLEEVSQRLSHLETTIVVVSGIIGMANDVFASAEDASYWLRKPHPLLNGMSPFDAAATAAGAQHVIQMLAALKYGGVV